MPKTRPLSLLAACCLCLTPSLTAQTSTPPAASPAATGAYFQALIKDAKTRIREIGIDQFAKLQKAAPSPILVDVREDNEWDKGRIPGAIHVGRGVLEARIESQVPQMATPVVLYCRSGGRSAVAADVLTKMGYTNVSSLAGGFTAWEAAGMPVEKSSPPK